MWDGFIIAEGDYPFHLTEVISLPVSTLMDPLSWWTIFHETAHAMIYGLGTLRRDNLVISGFLKDRIDPLPWRKLLEEIAAEIIGYELGFYGDNNYYDKLYWAYLGKTFQYLQESMRKEAYLLRGFMVKLYSEQQRHLDSDKGAFCPSKADLFVQLKDYISHVSTAIRVSDPAWADEIQRERVFLAANFLQHVIDLLPVCEYLYGLSRAGELDRTSKKRDELEDPNTIGVVSVIIEGKVYMEKINYPSAVLYLLNKKSRALNQVQKVAFIRSFSEAYTSEFAS